MSYPVKEMTIAILWQLILLFCVSPFLEFPSLLCPVCNLTLSRKKGHSLKRMVKTTREEVLRYERLLKLVPLCFFVSIKPNSLIFIEIESFLFLLQKTMQSFFL